MRTRTFTLLVAGALAAISFACTDLSINPASTSLTSAIDSPSFKRDIMPILRQTCGSASACHGGATPQQDLKLDNDSAAYASLVNVVPHYAPAQAAGLMRVRPFLPDSSFLMKVLSESTAVRLGYYRMPLTEYYLPYDPVRLTIQNWITKGALNN